MKAYIIFFSLFISNLLFGQELLKVKAKIISSLDSIPVISGTCKISNSYGESVIDVPWKEDGNMEVNFGNPGKYTFLFQSEGYSSKELTHSITQSTDLGRVYLKDNTIRLKVVTIEGKARFQIVKGDTTIYNPKALAMTPDATLKDMIK